MPVGVRRSLAGVDPTLFNGWGRPFERLRINTDERKQLP
jgi:hypothetical protein